MKLTDEERDILGGAAGEAAQWALRYQVRVGEFFDAARMVAVTSAHVAADMGLIGDAGLDLVERLAAQGARVRVPTITDPRSVDFDRYREFGQPEAHVAKERRLRDALVAMGMLACNTCINYQTVFPPRFGEHLAWGDTGSVTFANAVAGARSNFEGGPAAIAGALTGRVPEYGYHLAERRRATYTVEVTTPLRESSDWGALGAFLGRQVPGYWQVPAISGVATQPSVDELKHLAAALASFGSSPMFHAVGITPEARTLADALDGATPHTRLAFGERELRETYASFRPERAEMDLVVFTAPQLSLVEVQTITDRLAGRRVAAGTRMILTVNAQVKREAERLGFLASLQTAGADVLTGVCYYVMTPDVVREHLGYRTILTNSAKLANIIGGYGYNPVFRNLAACIDAALTGRLANG